MKIVLLTLFFMPFMLKAQVKKGGIVVSPQLFVSNFTSTYKDFGVSTSMHYFLTRNISVGAILMQKFSLYKAPDLRTFDRGTTYLQLLPEVQYQMFSGRFTPFVKLQFLNENFYFQHFYVDNPAIPEKQQRLRLLVHQQGFTGIGGSIGLNWYLNIKTSLYGVVNLGRENSDIHFNNLGVGVQFVVPNRKNKNSK